MSHVSARSDDLLLSLLLHTFFSYCYCTAPVRWLYNNSSGEVS